MNIKNDKAINQDSTKYNEKKKKYVTPSILVVPLKIEERLMGCGKMDFDCPEPQTTKLS